MNRVIKSYLYVVFLLMAFLSPKAFSMSLEASVNKTTLSENEIFSLTINADEIVSSSALNFDVLNKDFVVYGREFGTSVNIINGKRTQLSQWRITLAPTQLGPVTIPAFKIDNSVSVPIKLTVSKDRAAPNTADLAEFQSHLSTDKLYPNQSATLSTRLIIKADPKDLNNAQIIPPSAQGIELSAIGESKQYQKVINGVNVLLIDQDYEISANQPGDYKITGPSFQATLIYGNPYQGTQKMLPLLSKSQRLSLTVLAKPADHKGAWLPTPSLDLSQRWLDENGQVLNPAQVVTLKVGDSLTREIDVTIADLKAEHFPNLLISYPNALRVYSDKPIFTQLPNGKTQMSLKQVLIAQSPGQVALPKIPLTWWNSQTEKNHTSEVKGLSLKIIPDPNSPSLNAPSHNRPSNALINDEQTQAPDNALSQKDKMPTQAISSSASYWPYLTGFFALLWLLSLIYVVRLKKANLALVALAQDPPQKNPSSSMTEKALIISVQDKDWLKTRYLISQWINQSHLNTDERRMAKTELSGLLDKLDKGAGDEDAFITCLHKWQKLPEFTDISSDLARL